MYSQECCVFCMQTEFYMDILYNLWIHYTVCGYFIYFIYPCKMNSLLPSHSLCDGFVVGDCFWLLPPGIAQSPLQCSALSAWGFWGWKSLTGAFFRSNLMAGGAKRGVTNPWLLEESEETRGLGFDELRQQQRRIIEGTRAFLLVLSISGTLRGAFI